MCQIWDHLLIFLKLPAFDPIESLLFWTNDFLIIYTHYSCSYLHFCLLITLSILDWSFFKSCALLKKKVVELVTNFEIASLLHCIVCICSKFSGAIWVYCPTVYYKANFVVFIDQFWKILLIHREYFRI